MADTSNLVLPYLAATSRRKMSRLTMPCAALMRWCKSRCKARSWQRRPAVRQKGNAGLSRHRQPAHGRGMLGTLPPGRTASGPSMCPLMAGSLSMRTPTRFSGSMPELGSGCRCPLPSFRMRPSRCRMRLIRANSHGSRSRGSPPGPLGSSPCPMPGSVAQSN